MSKGYNIYVVRGDDGEVVQEWDNQDQCHPPLGDPPCGGCGECIRQQAEHAGLTVETTVVLPPIDLRPKRHTIHTFPVIWK